VAFLGGYVSCNFFEVANEFAIFRCSTSVLTSRKTLPKVSFEVGVLDRLLKIGRISQAKGAPL
jgi:hypothetical protein